MEVSLESLKSIRSIYERALGAGCDLSRFEQTLSDPELELMARPFYARSGNRLMSIQVESDSVPAAFLKKTGVDYDEILLQVIVNAADLKIEACTDLFQRWIVSREPEDIVQNLANGF